LIKPVNIKKTLLLLIIVSTIIRAALAYFLELTNDEVNYWLYAMYPDISHYEHPPMVGYFIQLTTLNLLFDSEFFMRLSSILLGAVNTYIIFLIGKKIKDELTGFYAAMLYTSSLYFFIICGVFIHPDTPMVFFWLISLYFIIKGLFIKPGVKFNSSILIAGLTIGLGMASKYISAYLWFAVIMYILLYDRIWLKKIEIYISVLISILCFLPVIIWNFQNELQTLSFWGMNIHALSSGLRFDLFAQELLGQIFYNNPVNFFLILISLVFIKKKFFPDNNIKRFLIICGLPLLIFFILISLLGRTLPHWSGPGYVALILIASAYQSWKKQEKQKLFPYSHQLAMVVTVLITIFGYVQINYGLFDLSSDKNVKPENLGKNDFTLDMYGWNQAAGKFEVLFSEYKSKGMIGENAPIYSDKWYNAGHLDYYIARPLGKTVFAEGTLGEIRKYHWVNEERRGSLENIKEAYYISPSRDYTSPYKYCSKQFSIIVPMDTIRIERKGKIIENMFVFIMKK